MFTQGSIFHFPEHFSHPPIVQNLIFQIINNTRSSSLPLKITKMEFFSEKLLLPTRNAAREREWDWTGKFRNILEVEFGVFSVEYSPLVLIFEVLHIVCRTHQKNGGK